ncbi:MAG TPA: DUF2294 domain-containing protein [Solirubrobacteraceae bacterium]|nr:DUF2294 domain-containing protein [Solirubrobacteraceae bacterium]
MLGEDTQTVEQEGGSLLAQISNEFVTMQKDYWGLGPVQAKSYMMDDLLLVVMRGGTTRAERTMLDFDRQDLVRDFRQSFENEMSKILTDKVERLTGRRVLTYQSQILFDPDIVAELFVFDKSADGGAAEIVATAEGQLRDRPHGEIHDDRGAAKGPDAQPPPTS